MLQARLRDASDVPPESDGDARAVTLHLDDLGTRSTDRFEAMAEELRGPQGVGVVVSTGQRSQASVRSELEDAGLHTQFEGVTPIGLRDQRNVCIVTTYPGPRTRSVPERFDVVAVMTVHNEADILEASLRRLRSQGIKVWLIDNWSTDGSFELASRLLEDPGVLRVERFPPAGPSPTYDWGELLSRVESVAGLNDGAWIIHHDVDEFRMGPWADVDLRTALHFVDTLGYNAVDHTVVNHHPIDDSFTAGCDFVEAMPYFEFGTRPGHFSQVKAWRTPGRAADLVHSGGHDARFPGRRVYPFNFLLRHYPIRSQEHGSRKVFEERRARWNPSERERGWHTQYDSVQEGHGFIRDRGSLELFEEASFTRNRLFERLLRFGIEMETQ